MSIKMAALALTLTATTVGGVHAADAFMERAKEHRALDTTVGIRDAIERAHTDDVTGLTVPDNVACRTDDCTTLIAWYGAKTADLDVALPAGAKKVDYARVNQDAYRLVVGFPDLAKQAVVDTCRDPSGIEVYDLDETVAPISTIGCIQ